ncbi:MAG: hypothetical protein JWR26_374 [Pedosphaera sp.]|nr:hypothetical protein [Pedosphaera sp.]
MTKWIRLYITVEGQTEKEFADRTLKPHLAGYSIDVRSRVVLTNRKLGKRGGILDFEKIRSDLGRLMKEDQHGEARFTTMVDLYALPSEFPGWAEARKKSQPVERVAALERALETKLAEPRFIPFIQLHEFEALLYCNLEELQRRIANSQNGINALRKEVMHLEPEEINEGSTTSPSKRIIRHIPIYERNKVRVGAPAAAAIGLNKLRLKCPHFGNWLSRLEALGTKTQAT